MSARMSARMNKSKLQPIRESAKIARSKANTLEQTKILKLFII